MHLGPTLDYEMIVDNMRGEGPESTGGVYQIVTVVPVSMMLHAELHDLVLWAWFMEAVK